MIPDEFDVRLEKLARARHAAVDEYRSAWRDEAEHEAKYRSLMSVKFAAYRAMDQGQEESKIHAEADASDHKKAWRLAEGTRRASKEVISMIERNQAMLRESSERERVTGGAV